jgi:hypothetical protein
MASRAGAAGARLRFGVIADPQYAEAPPNLTLGRYYANSLDKMRAAVSALNREDLSFVVTLGDTIDRDVASYDKILPIYRTLRHETRFVLGNHDFDVAPEHRGRVASLLGMASPSYDFAASGIRFVVLDGNDVSLFAPRRTIRAGSSPRSGCSRPRPRASSTPSPGMAPLANHSSLGWRGACGQRARPASASSCSTTTRSRRTTRTISGMRTASPRFSPASRT